MHSTCPVLFLALPSADAAIPLGSPSEKGQRAAEESSVLGTLTSASVSIVLFLSVLTEMVIFFLSLIYVCLSRSLGSGEKLSSLELRKSTPMAEKKGIFTMILSRNRILPFPPRD